MRYSSTKKHKSYYVKFSTVLSNKKNSEHENSDFAKMLLDV